MTGRGIRRVLLFSVLPSVGIASPLLVIPAITAQYGIDGFVAVSVGQSVGAAMAVLVEVGWGLTGPHASAIAGDVERSRLICVSLGTRAMTFLAAVVLGTPIAVLSVTHYPVSAGLSAVATAAIGLSLNWFFIGTGRPRAIFASDSVPKLTSALVGAGLLTLGMPLWTYPALQVASAFGGVIVALRLASISLCSWSNVKWVDYRDSIRSQIPVVYGRAFSATYLSLPVLIVTWVSPSAVAMFAAMDRMQRLLLALLAAVPNALQNWLGQASESHDIRRRCIVAIWLNACLGVIAGGGFAGLIAIVAPFIFSGTIVPTLGVAGAAGGIIGITCISRSTGSLALVHLGKVGWITVSAAAGLVVGLPLIAVGSGLGGARGGLLGMLTAEFVVLTVQCVGLRMAFRQIPLAKAAK